MRAVTEILKEINMTIARYEAVEHMLAWGSFSEEIIQLEELRDFIEGKIDTLWDLGVMPDMWHKLESAKESLNH